MSSRGEPRSRGQNGWRNMSSVGGLQVWSKFKLQGTSLLLLLYPPPSPPPQQPQVSKLQPKQEFLSDTSQSSPAADGLPIWKKLFSCNCNFITLIVGIRQKKPPMNLKWCELITLKIIHHHFNCKINVSTSKHRWYCVWGIKNVKTKTRRRTKAHLQKDVKLTCSWGTLQGLFKGVVQPCQFSTWMRVGNSAIDQSLYLRLTSYPTWSPTY